MIIEKKKLDEQLVGRAKPILALMEDNTVTDILINGVRSFYVEREGKLMRESSPFDSFQAIFDFIERLLIPLGKRIDAAEPYLDGRLGDGSRFHIILPPIASEGPLISIRKRRERAYCTLESFAEPQVIDWLVKKVKQGRNLLISGGTGSGKTTLLCRLLEKVSLEERIVVIEECLEISVEHPHLVHLESRPPSPDGRGEVNLRSLFRNALRMRPDRLILGECRGAEAFDLLQVMNSGHLGSFCTIHANSARDALKRLESLVLMAGFEVPLAVVREWIAGAIHGVVYLNKRGDKRQVCEIISLSGMEGSVYRIHPEFPKFPKGTHFL